MKTVNAMDRLRPQGEVTMSWARTHSDRTCDSEVVSSHKKTGYVQIDLRISQNANH